MLAIVRSNSRVWLSLAIALLFGLTNFLLQSHVGLSLWDEGFLWYGVQRVVLGETPLVDFMSYDVGRYYLSAIFMWAHGSLGIFPLRIAIAFVQVVGTFCGLIVIDRNIKSGRWLRLFYLMIFGLLFTLWMFPRHKQFDFSICLILLFFVDTLLRDPSFKKFVYLGAFTGLAAVVGRNHGVYSSFAALLSTTILICGSNQSSRIVFGFLLFGISTASAYLLLHSPFLLVDGFVSAFWQSVLFIFEMKNTNLPLPIPWLWSSQLVTESGLVGLQSLMVSFFFSSFPLSYVMALLFLVRAIAQRQIVKSHAGLIAAVVVSIPYSHYAYSRADIGHLAHAIYPLLIMFFALFTALPKVPQLASTIALAIVSLIATIPSQPFLACYGSSHCIKREIEGEDILIDASTGHTLRQIDEIIGKTDSPSLLVTPYWPGVYAVLGIRSPIWEIYALFDRSSEFQSAEIERIRNAKPKHVVILNMPLDGREELKYERTHSETLQFVRQNYLRLSSADWSPHMEVYLLREVGK